jgi:tRNA G18 (ribose-2'-O)-methylase SpoU
VRLPQAGQVDSLNVVQAAAVLMYEWVRRGGGESSERA